MNRLRAVAHPVRLEMLSLLTGVSLSAAEVARELGISSANASYHLRTLLGAGLLVVAGEEKVNGGMAKRYRHPWDAEPPAAAGVPLSESDRAAEVRTMAAAVPRRFERRLRSERGVLTDADLWVDPQVWAPVRDLVHEASRLMHANALPPRTEGAVRANLSVMAFRLEESR